MCELFFEIEIWQTFKLIQKFEYSPTSKKTNVLPNHY